MFTLLMITILFAGSNRSKSANCANVTCHELRGPPENPGAPMHPRGTDFACKANPASLSCMHDPITARSFCCVCCESNSERE